MDSLHSFDQVDIIIFDFDGTLYRSEALSLKIFQECLDKINKTHHLFARRPSNEEIFTQFGKQAFEIYPDILSTSEPKIIGEFAECVETAEIQAFKSGKGELYPYVLETLDKLKERGYRLAMCTNARIDYIEAALSRFSLSPYFEEIFAAGYYPGKNKEWMVKEILKRFGSKNSRFVVVGDRIHDIQAAKANGGIAIGCSFGFGYDEVKEADLTISAFSELLELFK
ncbi:MAG: HAD family hydrolase [Candidatus Heimdallarchaeota archaeon]